MSLLDIVIHGLTAHVTDIEREAASMPPYPIPAAQRAPRDRLLHELETRLLSQGDGPLTVTRIQGRPVSYRSEVASLGRRPGYFDFADAACALLAVGALDDTDVEMLAEFLPAYCGMGRQLVLNRLATDDLAEARTAAEQLADGLSWIGYRDIGAMLADRGDTEEFFTDWKRYAAGRDRTGMAEIRKRLVIGVARKEGWQAALAITRDKRVGPGFAKFAFYAFPAEDVEGLQGLLAGAAAGVLTEMDELSLLARAVRAASGDDPERNHPLLDEIVDRIIAVDPTVDKATMRWRDLELYLLWPAFGEQVTLDRVRSAVRTPRFRWDLTTLARDR
jgi:hypothetical protein